MFGGFGQCGEIFASSCWFIPERNRSKKGYLARDWGHRYGNDVLTLCLLKKSVRHTQQALAVLMLCLFFFPLFQTATSSTASPGSTTAAVSLPHLLHCFITVLYYMLKLAQITSSNFVSKRFESGLFILRSHWKNWKSTAQLGFCVARLDHIRTYILLSHLN